MEKNKQQTNRHLKLLYLYKIFYELTDEGHPLTLKEITDMLAEKGITAERKTLYNDIDSLRAFGADIILENNRYYLAERSFELPELKLLADAVCSARFITEKKSKALLKKISSLASVHDAKLLNRQLYVVDRVKSMNERIYINVDTINRAINEKKQISFKYFDYSLEKRPVYRDGLRIASPFAMTWDDEKYYMIAYYLKYPGSLTNFRIDRMTDIKILNEKVIDPPKKFEISEYMKSTFSMFSGETTEAVLKFDKSLVNPVIDRFGSGVTIKKLDKYHFTVKVNIKAEAPFFAWLFQFGDKASIKSPEELKEKYREMLRNVLKEAEK